MMEDEFEFDEKISYDVSELSPDEKTMWERYLNYINEQPLQQLTAYLNDFKFVTINFELLVYGKKNQVTFIYLEEDNNQEMGAVFLNGRIFLIDDNGDFQLTRIFNNPSYYRLSNSIVDLLKQV